MQLLQEAVEILKIDPSMKHVLSDRVNSLASEIE